MIFFLDASSLVKLYQDETGAETMRELFRRPELYGAFFVSELVSLEVVVRLAKGARIGGRKARRRRDRVLRQHASHRTAFFTILNMEPRVVHEAESIAIAFSDSGAGTLDLLHAASAQQVSELVPHEPLVFVAADRKLRSLAERIGFRTFDPENGDPALLTPSRMVAE
ncbi:MAG TPA: type II toxin-antitoxin system VapC family toxin [Longimicrobium sp.]